MNIAVCDDEKEMRGQIVSRIRSFIPGARVTEFPSGEELCASSDEFDIIYLDIKMDGQDGMQTAERLRKAGCNAAIIFVTALEEHVYRAFDVGAFHYLVKPVDSVRFFEVLRRAAEQCSVKPQALDAGKCIVVKKGREHVRVALSDIIYAEVFDRKVEIHGVSGDIDYYGRIAELERQAGEGFFRPHRAYLVNLARVQSYNGSEITLERGSVPIAKQKYHDFVRAYLRWLKEGKRNG